LVTARGQVAARLAWLVAWLAVAAMGALAITQALGLGSRGPLPALQSLTPLVLLPAFPIAVVAAVRNRRALALTAAGVGVALLVLAAPIAFPGHRPAVAADATRLRITFANLFRENQDPAAAAAVMAHDADVVAVVELNPVMATHLQAEAEAAGRYRYQLAQPTFGSEGLALYSRYPIVSADIRPIGSRLGLEAELDVDGQPVRLFVVHPFPPIFNGRLSAEWAMSLATIGDEATSPGPPTIVVGDFNASRWHPPFRRLLHRGLRDSHEWLGHGFSTSWPNDWPTPPFVRLDHALVGPGVVPTAIDDIQVPGSDHRGFVVDVAVNP
jgi:endonuclease/exonuclease/phosphatase (EEP) superfamily protein YafD